MADTLIENVSDTAFWVAHYRAVETTRSDALFQDPLAARLAGDRGRQIAQSMPFSFFTAWTIAVRTPLIDDYIRQAVSEGIDTVLNLGAGLDTRPYRMDLPGDLAWIEVDYPEVVAFKEQKLEQERPRCQLTRIKLDLANVAERRQLLADVDARAKKILVLTEGVIPYLSEEEAASLADDLSALGHVASWVVDYFAKGVFKQRHKMLKGKLRHAPFKFDPEDWFAFFGSHGWRCKEMRFMADEAVRLKRPFPMPLYVKLIWTLRSAFMSRARRESFRTFAGYARLEPNSRA
jgi:methyltransferase (TIGR00027 family)